MKTDIVKITRENYPLYYRRVCKIYDEAKWLNEANRSQLFKTVGERTDMQTYLDQLDPDVVSDDVRKKIMSERDDLYLMLEDDKVCGYLLAGPALSAKVSDPRAPESMDYTDRTFTVEILPGYRHKGYGTQLVEHALKDSPDKKFCMRMPEEMCKDLEPFYEKLGFEWMDYDIVLGQACMIPGKQRNIPFPDVEEQSDDKQYGE